MGIHKVSGAVFLDRDGVLNQAVLRDGKPYPPASVEEMVVAADAAEALSRLKGAGYRLVVVTNQPDVARGAQRREIVEEINHALARTLPIDEFRVCYHADEDGCSCRKPQPGLLLQEPVCDLGRSVMIGDRWRDIEAGWRARVRATILVGTGYGEPFTVDPDVRVRSLGDAADWILQLDSRAHR